MEPCVENAMSWADHIGKRKQTQTQTIMKDLQGWGGWPPVMQVEGDTNLEALARQQESKGEAWLSASELMGSPRTELVAA